MLRVEFHCHTIVSKDSLTKPVDLIKTCLNKQIDRVVITDHNTITGALQAQQINPELVVVGLELMTSRGEFLAAYVREEIPSGLSPLESITRLREQGAFISVSHPFDKWRSGHWEESDLLEILPHIDAIETFNARCLREEFNRKAEDFASVHNVLGTVGSDAHTSMELGRATIELPEFCDAQSLKVALQVGRTVKHRSPAWIHFTSRYAVWYKQVNKLIRTKTLDQ